MLSFFGFNPDCDSLPEFVTFNGSLRAAGSSDYYDGIKSSSVGDTDSTGLGAQKVFIEGINDDGDLASEVVSMNGTSVVSLTNSYFQINTCATIQAGGKGTNLGTFTLQVGGIDSVAGNGNNSALYNLGSGGYPRGFMPMLQNIEVNVSRDSSSTTAGDIIVSLYHVQNEEGDVVMNEIREYKFPFSSLNQGTQTMREKTLVPPNVITGPIQGTDFDNVPTSGYFYFYASGDAAVSAIVNCRADLLYRDVRA